MVGLSFQSASPVMRRQRQHRPGGWRGASPARRRRAELGLGLGEGAFVLGAHGGVEQSAVAEAHRRGDVPEQLHQRLQRDPGVDQGGGVGVPQGMGRGRGDFGGVAGAGEFGAQRLRGDSASLVDEQELDRSPGAWVWQRPAGGAAVGDPVEDVDGFVSSGTIRSVASLPSGTFSQAPWPSISCTQSSSRSRSSPMRSPVARVSSSASACSRVSGRRPARREVLERVGQAAVGVRRADSAAAGAAVGECRGERSGCRVGAAGHPHCRMSVRNWRTVRICPRWCPTDIAVPSACWAAASAASHASMWVRRSSTARSVTGGSRRARKRPNPARWLAIALTVAGARVAAAWSQ